MSTIRKYLKYIFTTPRLYRIYTQTPPQPAQPQQLPPLNNNNEKYTPHLLESLTDSLITYILPITLLLSIYNRKLSYLQFTVIVYVTSRILRSISRLSNPEYSRFLSVLEKSHNHTAEDSSSSREEALEALQSYDFEFSYFPVTHNAVVSVDDWESSQNRSGALSYYISWLIAHSFGIRLIYPGLLLGGVLSSVLEEGRGKLVVEKGGRRIKIRVDGGGGGGGGGGVVELDSIVFDNRGKGGRLGGTLVICCEGNAGFYEIGMIGGALSEGYSVLGWNHPGFGGSTGVPYPATELCAALGVMDYALNVLGFKENEILLYGWSIGGFPASYLASRYQGVKGLLLDATFDTILPLAIPRMPQFMASLVTATINNHVNLNNVDNLEHYSGPLRMIRRTDDEIIADPPGVLKYNRGNALLMAVVLGRFKERNGGRLPGEGAVYRLVEWVNEAHDREVGQLQFDSLGGEEFVVVVDDNKRGDEEEEARVLIGIASSILRDYKATHCVPLPREFYRI